MSRRWPKVWKHPKIVFAGGIYRTNNDNDSDKEVIKPDKKGLMHTVPVGNFRTDRDSQMRSELLIEYNTNYTQLHFEKKNVLLLRQRTFVSHCE